MRENIPPEEKLLKLIRGEKKKIAPAEKPEISPTSLKTPLQLPKFISIQKYLPLLNIQKIIKIAFIISCTYLIASFLYPFFGLKKIALPKIVSKEVSQSEIETKQEVKPYEFYLEGLRGHQIFGGQTLQETARPAGVITSDLMKDINLVGIVSGDNPQAIIEDKKTQKTYYLTKGQFIGEFQVEDIQEGKVILNYRGERFELYL